MMRCKKEKMNVQIGGAVPTSSAGSILDPDAVRARCQCERPAAASQDLPGHVEGEDNANELAFKIQVIKHDPFGGGRDLIQPKSVGRERLQPRPPIRFQRGAARIDVSDLAFT